MDFGVAATQSQLSSELWDSDVSNACLRCESVLCDISADEVGVSDNIELGLEIVQWCRRQVSITGGILRDRFAQRLRSQECRRGAEKVSLQFQLWILLAKYLTIFLDGSADVIGSVSARMTKITPICTTIGLERSVLVPLLKRTIACLPCTGSSM